MPLLLLLRPHHLQLATNISVTSFSSPRDHMPAENQHKCMTPIILFEHQFKIEPPREFDTQGLRPWQPMTLCNKPYFPVISQPFMSKNRLTKGGQLTIGLWLAKNQNIRSSKKVSTCNRENAVHTCKCMKSCFLISSKIRDMLHDVCILYAQSESSGVSICFCNARSKETMRRSVSPTTAEK